jgi:hypothetical protein
MWKFILLKFGENSYRIIYERAPLIPRDRSNINSGKNMMEKDISFICEICIFQDEFFRRVIARVVTAHNFAAAESRRGNTVYVLPVVKTKINKKNRKC